MKISVELLKVIVVFIDTSLCPQSSYLHCSSSGCSSVGDTLLAIRAPIGTQLEVPIPENVSCERLPLFRLRLSRYCPFHPGFLCSHPGRQRPEEVPDPPQELVRSHRGAAGQQRPVQRLSRRPARPPSRRCPTEPPGTDAYLSATQRCLPGLRRCVILLLI